TRIKVPCVLGLAPSCSIGELTSEFLGDDPLGVEPSSGMQQEACLRVDQVIHAAETRYCFLRYGSDESFAAATLHFGSEDERLWDELHGQPTSAPHELESMAFSRSGCRESFDKL